ncbi:peroxiredoxin [Paenibacillus sp. V4I3]|uniref:redoxin domain-containing protein n=1 Tax=Paenibacillus sp. V4I3 TaxID=3042305 RepID=UPI0027887A6A|nr:redoxin domain-containing protein [Paenibacillus sp. V4I3]MDQ0876579.1 peroxiredoxin [Paenibacillus sp. V4I3]
MNQRILQWVMVVVIVILASVTIISQIYKSSSPIQEKTYAANFQLKTLDGRDLSLSDYRGKGVVLNFWGTFCKPCRDEMPALEKEYLKYKDQGLVIIGMNASEPQKTVSAFVKELGVDFPIVLDPGLKVADIYQANALPHSVFIQPDGQISHINLGQMDEKTIETLIKPILPK